MRSQHIGAVVEEPVSCNPGFGSSPAICAVLPDENNFWTEVNPPQQQSTWLPGGVDKPRSRSLNLAGRWCLFPSLLLLSLITLCLLVCVPMWLTIGK